MGTTAVAVNETTLRSVFTSVLDNISVEDSFRTSGDFRVFGDFKASFHLDTNGKFDLVGPNPSHPIYKDGFVHIREADIRWERLGFGVELNIRTITVGGQCIIKLFGKCRLRLPKKSFFTRDPDVSTGRIGLDDVVESEISIGFTPIARRATDPDDPNQKQWHIVPRVVFFDGELLDLADTAANIVQKLLKAIVDAAFGWLPGWARDIVDAIVGGLVNLIRRILDLGDDLTEWLSRQLRFSIGLFNIVAQLAARHFEEDLIISGIDTPLELLPEQPPNQNTPSLPAVHLPIQQVSPSVTDSELLVEIEV